MRVLWLAIYFQPRIALLSSSFLFFFFMWLNIIQAKLNSSELASGLRPLGNWRALCVPLLLVLLCTVALLTDRSGSIFAYLRIIADSCSLSSLPAWWFGKYFLR